MEATVNIYAEHALQDEAEVLLPVLNLCMFLEEGCRTCMRYDCAMRSVEGDAPRA